jgi:vanillate O-demethylase monooxygenase subunit
MEENPDAVFYNLNIDGGAMWARRVLEKMMDAERPPALHAAE